MSELEETHSLHQRSRGYAVIITNKWFPIIDIESGEDHTRLGAGEDDANLQHIFDTKLKFQLLENKTFMNVNKSNSNFAPIWIHNDPPQNKVDCKCLSCKIQTTDHSGTDCFVLAISTHGTHVDGKQEICFSDDFGFGDERVNLEDIIRTLSDENCRTLAGKVRIIILSLCRSNTDIPKDKQDKVWHDEGVVINESNNENITEQFQSMDFQAGAGDSPNQDGQSDNGETANDANDEEFYYGTEEALRNLPSNFLVVFPCVRGKKTFHHKDDGSWLIDELRKAVDEHDFSRSPEMNFLSVLTKTAGRVAVHKESEKGKKTAVCIVHRLLEPLIFKEVPKKDENQPDLGEDKPAI